MMQIQLAEQDAKGKAFATVDNQTKAEMTYSRAGSHLLIINHTEVHEDLRGMGVGRKLLDKIVSYAREQDLKILPLCPYAKSVFAKDSSIHDVLKT